VRLPTGQALNVVEVAGEYLKDDKVTRANGVSPTCQAGRVKLLAGTWNDLFVGQLAAFPRATTTRRWTCWCTPSTTSCSR